MRKQKKARAMASRNAKTPNKAMNLQGILTLPNLCGILHDVAMPVNKSEGRVHGLPMCCCFKYGPMTAVVS